MYDSLWEQAAESPSSEDKQWYSERAKDDEHYRIQPELLDRGPTRKAKLTQLPPRREGEPSLWAVGLEGASRGQLGERPKGACFQLLQPPATTHQLLL